MAIAVDPETNDDTSLSDEENAVLEYIDRNPGDSYMEIVHSLTKGVKQEYDTEEIIDGVESLRRTSGAVERYTEGTTEYFEPGDNVERLLEK